MTTTDGRYQIHNYKANPRKSMTQTTINDYKPTYFTVPFAHNGDKNTIAGTSDSTEVVNIAKGFPSKFSSPRASGGKSVARKDMNGILHDISSLNYYFQYMGRNPWVANMAYPSGAKVWHNNSEWVSTTDNNSEQPSEDSSKWVKINDLAGTVGGTGGGVTADEISDIWSAIAALSSYQSSSGGSSSGGSSSGGSNEVVTIMDLDKSKTPSATVLVPGSSQYMGNNELLLAVNFQVYAHNIQIKPGFSSTLLRLANGTRHGGRIYCRYAGAVYDKATQIGTMVYDSGTLTGTVFYTKIGDPLGTTSDMWLMAHFPKSSTNADYYKIGTTEAYSSTKYMAGLPSTFTNSYDIGFEICVGTYISVKWKQIKFYVDNVLKYSLSPSYDDGVTTWGTYSDSGIFSAV